MINSKKLLAFSFLLSILTYISTARATDQLLATFSTDISGDTYQLTAKTDQDQSLTNFIVTKILKGVSIQNRNIPLNYFEKDGIALYQTDIQNLTKIYGINLSEQDGGIIVVESFLNSTSHNAKTYQLELMKDKSKWNLTYNGKLITKIHETLGVTGYLDFIIE